MQNKAICRFILLAPESCLGSYPLDITLLPRRLPVSLVPETRVTPCIPLNQMFLHM